MSRLLTYKEYLKKLDEMHEWELVGNNGKNPLVELSTFSRDYPKVYESYRQKMREEQNGNYMSHNDSLNGEIWD